MSDSVLVYRYASDILECAREQLSVTGTGVPAGMRCVVTTGEATAWDDCCNGQLTVTIQSIFPSSNFPTQDDGTRVPCGVVAWGASLAITVLRCAPTISQSGKPPSVERVDASTQEVVADASAIRAAILCRFKPAAPDVDVLIGAQQFVGPEGGCVGSVLLMTIGFMGE